MVIETSPQIDSLLDQASNSTDMPTIQNLYYQAQHAIMNTASVYPIYYTYNLYAESKNVKNFNILSNEDPYKMIYVTVETGSMSTLIAPIFELTVPRLPKFATLTKQLY